MLRPSRLLLCALTVYGCGADESFELIVEVHSDLVAGRDFDGVRLELRPGERSVTTSAGLLDDYAMGERVGSFSGLAPDTYALRAVLVRAGVGDILERRARVQVDRDIGVTLVMSRSCIGVSCGDDETCLGGGCVSRECTPLTPEGCGPPACTDDGSCPSTVDCAEQRCVEGACLNVLLLDVCTGGQVCHHERGCVDARDACDACELGQECCAGICVPEGCDDGEVCTDDACGAIGCTHEPNEAACDDGTFCNGVDTCSSGTCSVHSGDPCPGASSCDEAILTCTGCASDTDCPAEIVGPFGACGGFADACAASGTQMRTVSNFRCESDGVCSRSDVEETQGCSRSSDGLVCGSPVFDDWTACGNFDSFCDATGTQTRTRTDLVCASETCSMQDTPEIRSCSRDPTLQCAAPAACEAPGPTCDIATDSCVFAPLAAGTECRAASCGDPPELCDGSSTACPAPCGCRGETCCSGDVCGTGLTCASGTCCTTTSPSATGGWTRACAGRVCDDVVAIRGTGTGIQIQTVGGPSGTQTISLTEFSATGSWVRCGVPGCGGLSSIIGSGSTIRIAGPMSTGTITLDGATASGGWSAMCSMAGCDLLTGITGAGSSIRIGVTGPSGVRLINLTPVMTCSP